VGGESVIKSFKSKALAEFFETGRSRKIQQKHEKKLRLILSMLNVATHPAQMAAPGLRYHPLVGPMKGLHAVDVDGNTRVTFAFRDGHAIEVDYGDYH
jgi:proteic killer suppression protein